MDDHLRHVFAAKASEMTIDTGIPLDVARRIRVRRFALVATTATTLMVVVAGVLTWTITPTQRLVTPAPEVPNEKLTNDFDIFTMAPNGSNVIRVTESADDETQPAWSPNGKRLAFVRYDEPGRAHIFVTDPGGPEIQLTFGDTVDEAPAWSPDGRFIAFQRSGLDQGPRVFLLDLEGYQVRPHRLIAEPGTSFEAWPTWSPDGKQIAFVGSDATIFVVDVAGNVARGPVTPLVKSTGGFGKIAWGPARRIATTVFNELEDIYVVNDDGSGLTRITDLAEVPDRYPSWSPDGSHIVFMVGAPNEDDEIYTAPVISVDGFTARQITDNDAHDGVPAWSPNGRRIAFASNR